MLDLLIRGGTVVDGTGSAPYAADVAVENGRIVEVGTLPGAHARRIISADGKLVTPGFIDIHRHADLAAWRPGFGQPELRQGLTTIVNGNCGLSAAPMRRAKRAEIAAYLQPICGEMPKQVPTDSLADFFAGQPEAPIHTGMLVGAGVLRASAAGYALEHLEDRHYKAIHRAMEQALADGALGISLGLGYAPECFYTTQELIRALEPLTGQSIPVTVHMRQEGGGVLEALEEMLTVARALRIPVHISHLKAMGRDNWGVKISRALAMLEQARQEGLEVGCDVYPYTAGSTQLIHILPPDFLTGGIEAVVQRLQDKGARRELAERIRRDEQRCDHYEDVLGTYLVKLSTQQMGAEESEEATELLKTIGDLERISDHAVNVLESAEELREKGLAFSGTAQEEYGVLAGAVREILHLAINAFAAGDSAAAAQVEPLEEVIDKLKEQMRTRHILRMQRGACSIEAGFVWSDLLTDLERISDHCSNIAGCVLDAAQHNLNLHETLRTVRREDADFRTRFAADAEKYRLPDPEE